MFYNRIFLILLSILSIFLITAKVYGTEVRVKDIARVGISRVNYLVGYGLVVGLKNTGDSTSSEFTKQAIANMLERMGIKVPKGSIRTRNTAAVMVTAELPTYAKPGTRIDVVVSALGDAKSLEGGTLIMTPLLGPDGEVYAIAQGPISLGGGYEAGGKTASLRKFATTTGRIPQGAIVEKNVPVNFSDRNELDIVLNEPDFKTASNLAEVINEEFSSLVKAVPVSPETVKVFVKKEGVNVVDLVAKLGELPVEVDYPAVIVINERTGTVVINDKVRVSPVAVAQGGVTVKIAEQPVISQPPMLSSGQTILTQKTSVQLQEGKNMFVLEPKGPSLQDLVMALNAVGVTPRQLIAILQAMKSAGAIHAEIRVQ
jgi:flagellar P-ring protein precursor FlgI